MTKLHIFKTTYFTTDDDIALPTFLTYLTYVLVPCSSDIGNIAQHELSMITR